MKQSLSSSSINSITTTPRTLSAKFSLNNVSSMDSMLSMLNNPTKAQFFQKSLEKQFCGENGLFYEAYKKFEDQVGSMTEQEVEDKLQWFFKEFLEEGGPKEINIPVKLKKAFAAELVGANYTFVILKPVRDEVLKMLYENNYKGTNFNDRKETSMGSLNNLGKSTPGSKLKTFTVYSANEV